MKKRIIRSLIGHWNESGTVLIICVLSTTILFALLGLVRDFRLIYVENRQLQTATNAAAVRGVYTLMRKDTANIAMYAQAELTRNGYEECTSVINHPPQNGDYAGDEDFVEVILTKELQTYFGNFFQIGAFPDHDTVTVQTRAVAGLTGYGSGCIFVLSWNGGKAFYVSSGSMVVSPGCDVIVSSRNPSLTTAAF